jgi:hypothetical protein
MRRFSLIELSPALLIAAGILVATSLAMHLTGWLVWVPPLLLACTVLGANMLQSRLRGPSLLPTPPSLILASAILVVAAMVGTDSPKPMANMMPILGATAVLALARQPRRHSEAYQYP